MTENTSASDAEMRAAVETMLARLEREHAWTQELRADLELAEHEVTKLLNACDAAIHALPMAGWAELALRASKIALHDVKRGRPPKDRRHTVIMRYLANRPDQEVTSAEIRKLLRRHGLRNTSQYVGCAFYRWVNDGLVSRLGRGRFLVNGEDKRLRRIRLEPASDSDAAAVRAEIAKGRAEAEVRFEARCRDEHPSLTAPPQRPTVLDKWDEFDTSHYSDADRAEHDELLRSLRALQEDDGWDR